MLKDSATTNTCLCQIYIAGLRVDPGMISITKMGTVVVGNPNLDQNQSLCPGNGKFVNSTM